jgi:hypothetical protein
MIRSRRPGADGDRGAAVMLFALTLTVLVGMAAFAIDLGNARQESRHAQASSDAGALAGAQDLPVQGADAVAAATAKSTAASYAASNVLGSAVTPTEVTCGAGEPTNASCYEAGDASIVVATPYDTSSSSLPDHNLIYVRTCRPTETFFAGALGATSPTVCREAVARFLNSAGGFGYGLVALNPDDCAAMRFRGDSDTTLSSNGAVVVNSSCTPNALDASGTSWQLVTNFIGVVGGASLNPCDPEVSTVCTDTVPTEGINPFTDPLALSAPAVPSTTRDCDGVAGTNPDVRILEPGRYDRNNGCSWNYNGTYVLRPGLYYMDEGFSSNGSANFVCADSGEPTTSTEANTLGCEGVTLYVASGDYTLNGSSVVYLPSPDHTDDTYAGDAYPGVTIFQASCDASTINGGSDFLLDTVYAPCALLDFSGNGGGDAVNIEGIVVADSVDIGGTFDFNIQVPQDGPEIAPFDESGLVE